jgi:hypothetical protein
MSEVDISLFSSPSCRYDVSTASICLRKYLNSNAGDFKWKYSPSRHTSVCSSGSPGYDPAFRNLNFRPHTCLHMNKSSALANCQQKTNQNISQIMEALVCY